MKFEFLFMIIFIDFFLVLFMLSVILVIIVVVVVNLVMCVEWVFIFKEVFLMECVIGEFEYGIMKGLVDVVNGDDDDDEEEEEELSFDEICLEVKEVVQYIFLESFFEEDDDIREDVDDFDYGGGRSKCQEMILKINL